MLTSVVILLILWHFYANEPVFWAAFVLLVVGNLIAVGVRVNDFVEGKDHKCPCPKGGRRSR